MWFLLRNCLLQTLRHTMQVLDCVKSKGIEVKFHGRAKNEASHYCGVCEVNFNRAAILMTHIPYNINFLLFFFPLFCTA